MIRYAGLLSFFLLLFLSCSRQGDNKEQKMITVSIPPQVYLTERIAGNEYRVNILVPPGMGPETYEPSPADLESVATSDFWFLSGYLDFESQLLNKIQSFSDLPRIVDLSQGLELIRNPEHGADKGEKGGEHTHGVDPHYWMSPKEMKKVTERICKALIENNPEKKDTYLKNKEELIKDISRLDSTLTGDFKNLKTRKFILFHPSLAYLARDYNLEQLSLEQGGKQPSTRHLAALIDEAEKEQIHTVFLQSQFDVNNMETLAKELSGKLEKIDPLSADWLNNMYLVGGKLKDAMNGK